MKRVLLFLMAIAAPAWAHKPSDAHVMLDARGDGLGGRVDVAVRDLDGALAIDDGDGDVTWGDLEAAAPRIERYLADRLHIAGCTMTFGASSLVDLSDGPYWSTPLTATCHDTRALTITYSLLFDIDAQHRGLIHLAGQTLIARDASPVTATIGSSTSVTSFVREGIWHIWQGIDHVLFLLCLLLPAVWRRESQGPASPGRAATQRVAESRSISEVSREVFEIVTAFTLAHSITLVISAVGLVTLPSRFVETAIALSVVAAAVNNLVRAVDARWAVAFALGLLHGFGFSSVLVDLGLPSHELIGTLLGFNLGVEIGQAAIVICVLPLLYTIRKTVAYRALLFAGSGAVVLIATYWTCQRLVA
ncbi:MAG TPA: HupE/UreJ family protein [Kofleriaceae bacterium]|nr:HupE/UreJ family protein [Kofleriaceae bacterium]